MLILIRMKFSFDLNKIMWDHNLSWSKVGSDTSVQRAGEWEWFLRVREMPVLQMEEKFLIESKCVPQFMEYLWKVLIGLIASAVTRNIISAENAKAIWWHIE